MQQSDWAVVNLARRLGSKFNNDWQQLSLGQRRRWARSTLAGLLVTLAALFASIFVLATVHDGLNHFPWEEHLLRAIERNTVSFGTAVWLQTFGTDFMLVFVVATTAALAIWNERPLLGVSILLSMVVMDAVVRIGWFAFERFRPDLIAQGVASTGLHSFPSGHTAKTLAVYGLLGAQWYRASRSIAEQALTITLIVLIAIAVPLGRLRMGVHWPTDVLGGYLIGGIWLAFLLRALHRGQRL